LKRCLRFLNAAAETLSIDIFTCILVEHKVLKSTLELLRYVSRSYTNAPFIRAQLVARGRIRSASIYLFLRYIATVPKRPIKRSRLS